MSNSDYLSHALAYARACYLVVPIIGKAPVHAGGHGWADGSRHLPEVEWLFTRRRHTGLGIATGEGSGAWVLDLDGHDGKVSLKALINEYGPLPATPVSVTRNGLHLWFAYTPECEALRNRVRFAPGLDIRTTGGGVVVPPSAHPEGGHYSWRDVSLLDMDPPPAPDWLIAEILQTYRTPDAPLPTSSPTTVIADRYAEGALQSAECRIVMAGNGQQRATLYTEALSIGARIVGPGMCSEAAALDRLTAAGLRMVNHKRQKWTPLAVQRIVADGLSAGIGRVNYAA